MVKAVNLKGIVDQSGRIIDYVRVSVTQKCNLRCMYCMPENAHFIEEKLSFDDDLKLLKVFHDLGVKKVKITGGEPLIRKDIDKFVHELKHNIGFDSVTITTNGILLNNYIDSFLESGIDGINISLDSLKPEVYEKITRGGDFNKVMGAIDELIARGYKKTKLNVVAIKGVNDDEILDFVEFANTHLVAIRFIELMPISEATNFKGVKREEILEKIESKYGKKSLIGEKLGNGPAEYYTFENFNGKVGFIDAVGNSFCENCNRVRIDSNGKLRLCLEYNDGISMRDFINGEISEEDFKEKLKGAIYRKPLSNDFDKNSVNDFNMNNIGG